MSQRKSERIVNLAICLLSTKRLLSREEIRSMVVGYQDTTSDAAFERTFERDKDELRSIGVPVETGVIDAFFEDEIGYRIPRTDFELPPVDFTAEEAVMLGIATAAWQEAGVAESTLSALTKLRAAGVDPEPRRLRALQPAVQASEPAFEPLWQAALHSKVVTFTYRDAREVRTVEPWLVTNRSGAWYLMGHDRARHEVRRFKIARISSEVTLTKQGFEIPADVDLVALAKSLEPPAPDRSATLAIRDGRADILTKRATQLDAPATPEGQRLVPDGFNVWNVPYIERGDFAATIARFGPNILVLDPPRLREAVIKHLTDVVAIHGGGQS